MGKKGRNTRNKQRKNVSDGLRKPKSKAAPSDTGPKFSVDQLLDKVEEYTDTFEFELAQKFCQRALDLDPDHVRALETSGTLLLELGNMENASICFQRAAALEPDTGHSKYMYLGQMSTGIQAIQYFQKGIELMEKTLAAMGDAKLGATAEPQECEVSAKDISEAYCSVAEIYLTDACFEENAEVRCKECLDRAVELHSDNAEAYQLLASFYLSKEQQELAKSSLEKGLSLWLPQLKEAVKPEGAALENEVEVCPLTYPTRLSAAKLLIELENYEVASEVLELLLDEEDEVVEVWYLLGWANYLQGEDYKANARYYLHKAKEVAVKVKCDDQQVVQHVEELVKELGPASEEEQTAEEENGGGDSDLDSESDMDGDESRDEKPTEGQGEAMEH